MLALLALAGGAYLWRVEVLVKRRTAELTHSLREREQLARLNAQHQEALGHLSRLSILGELSAMLAHELNHPLATISNYAAGLQSGMRVSLICIGGGDVAKTPMSKDCTPAN